MNRHLFWRKNMWILCIGWILDKRIWYLNSRIIARWWHKWWIREWKPWVSIISLSNSGISFHMNGEKISKKCWMLPITRIRNICQTVHHNTQSNKIISIIRSLLQERVKWFLWKKSKKLNKLLSSIPKLKVWKRLTWPTKNNLSEMLLKLPKLRMFP